MANFAIVLDPDTQRRSRFAAAICPEIAPVEGLLVNQRHQGALSVVWAAAPNAPVDIDQDGSGLAVVWGEAIAPDSARRQTAASLRTAWQTRPENLFDGFYAAFTYERQSGLTVGGDVLGFFPLYYWRGPDVVVICSSPELLRYHPDFTPRLCVDGLIGILLMRGIADSRCLWQGVTRLGAGDWLTVLPDLQVTTRQQYRIPCNKTDIEAAGYQNLFLEEQLEALTAALDRAIARHAPAADQQGLMLSGGLDSRMLAGFLHQQQATPQLLTFGRRDDLEVLCARSVAQTTGWSHLQVNPDQILAKAEPSLTQRCLDAADQLTRWDHLAGGGGSFAGLNWSEMAASIPIAPRMVTGLAMDRTICGTHVSPPTFEGALAYEYNRGGLSPAQLRQLFVKDDWLQGKITGVIDQLH
ncbi:MAG: asparagine synthase-related protein, partial [Cyanobacteria bacterium P01_H01_bin.119]